MLLPSLSRSPFRLRSRQMSTFRVIQHVVRAQHSRDRFAGAELGHENDLRLHVKQYIPHSNPDPKPGDVTIIGAVADSFPKETMEPLWDDLCARLDAVGRRVRAIWIADPVNQGASGVLNERILGPDRNAACSFVCLLSFFVALAIRYEILGPHRQAKSSELSELTHLS